MIAIFEDMINSFVAFVIHAPGLCVCAAHLWYASFRSIFITAHSNVPGHFRVEFGACAIGWVRTKQRIG